MKEIFLCTVILIPLLLGCNNIHQSEGDLADNDLVGSVKSCKFSTYDAVDVNGKIVKGPYHKNEFDYPSEYFTLLTFRPDGLIDEYSLFETNGELYKRIKYIYNSMNMKMYEISYSGKYESPDTMFFYYNEDLKILREEWYASDNSHGIRRFSYDKNGFLIADSTFRPPWKLINRNEWKNDNRGNVIENAFYWENNKLFSHTYRDYDKENRKIYEAIYYPNDKDLNDGFVKFKYTRLNKIQLEERYTKDKELLKKTVFEYYNNGNEKKSKTTNLEYNYNSIITYEYQYDEVGNWINKISTFDDKPSLFYEREISYY